MSKVFNEIADIIGKDAAQELTDRFGGIQLHIPTNPGRDSVISLAIGRNKAEKLGSIYGGCSIQLPSKQSSAAKLRKNGIERCIRQGMPHREIAINHGVTVQWVYRVAQLMRAQ